MKTRLACQRGEEIQCWTRRRTACELEEQLEQTEKDSVSYETMLTLVVELWRRIDESAEVALFRSLECL